MLKKNNSNYLLKHKRLLILFFIFLILSLGLFCFVYKNIIEADVIVPTPAIAGPSKTWDNYSDLSKLSLESGLEIDKADNTIKLKETSTTVKNINNNYVASGNVPVPNAGSYTVALNQPGLQKLEYCRQNKIDCYLGIVTSERVNIDDMNLTSANLKINDVLDSNIEKIGAEPVVNTVQFDGAVYSKGAKYFGFYGSTKKRGWFKVSSFGDKRVEKAVLSASVSRTGIFPENFHLVVFQSDSPGTISNEIIYKAFETTLEKPNIENNFEASDLTFATSGANTWTEIKLNPKAVQKLEYCRSRNVDCYLGLVSNSEFSDAISFWTDKKKPSAGPVLTVNGSENASNAPISDNGGQSEWGMIIHRNINGKYTSFSAVTASIGGKITNIEPPSGIEGVGRSIIKFNNLGSNEITSATLKLQSWIGSDKGPYPPFKIAVFQEDNLENISEENLFNSFGSLEVPVDTKYISANNHVYIWGYDSGFNDTAWDTAYWSNLDSSLKSSVSVSACAYNVASALNCSSSLTSGSTILSDDFLPIKGRFFNAKIELYSSNPAYTPILDFFRVDYKLLAPKISSISPANGPVGTAVTISGESFGSAKGTSLVKLGGTIIPDENISSWSNNEIIISIPSGAIDGYFEIIAGGGSSNSTNFTVTTPSPAAPSISTVIPNPAFYGSVVVVSGLNFGSTGNIKLNGTIIKPLTWLDNMIKFTVDSSLLSGEIIITNSAGSVNFNPFSITDPITPPLISEVSPKSAGVGELVTIKGSGFGESQGSSLVYLSSKKLNPASWSNDLITFIVPADAASGKISVATKDGAVEFSDDFILSAISYEKSKSGTIEIVSKATQPVTVKTVLKEIINKIFGFNLLR